MNWILKTQSGQYIAGIDQYCYHVVSSNAPQPLIFHGTRDYIEGVIFALELMGHEKFIPEMKELEELEKEDFPNE